MMACRRGLGERAPGPRLAVMPAPLYSPSRENDFGEILESSMTSLWLHRASVVLAMLAPASALAADSDHGKTLAQRWCVSCHVVEPAQNNATTDAPPFTSVAKRPDFNESKLAFFLLDPHPKMPNMQLSRDDAADIAAYIASLGPRGSKSRPATPKSSRRAGNFQQ
jgi:mono/diheme cytochrome c family protein